MSVPPIVVGQRERLWQSASYAYALLVALGVGYFLVRMSLQLSDCLVPMLDAQSAPSVWQLMRSRLDSEGYLRPLWWAQVKVLFDLSGGHYWLVYKAWHVAWVIALLLLFARLVNVRSRAEWLVLPLATTVLIGSHTFLGTVWEAFPVNHYLEITVACLLAANLASSRGGWYVDLTAVITLAAAIFTIESGVLVWVCLAVGYLVGYRGVSARGIWASTAVLVLYGYIRFVQMPVGLPEFAERSSGFWLSRLDPDELRELFGERPLWFYAYNVASSVLTVLFSEPRAGEVVFLRRLLLDELRPWVILNLVSSLLTTSAIAWFVRRRLGGWVRLRFAHDDRIVLMFVAVLLANAVISYPYTKDVIMSPAGAFYALAVFFAGRELLARLSCQPVRGIAVAGLLLTVLLASGAWSVRAVGLHYNMRTEAFLERNDWARSERWLADQGLTLSDARSRELVATLRAHAIQTRVPNPRFVQEWAAPYFDGQR